MNDDEASVSAALDRLGEVASNDHASDAELDAAIEAAFRTPGVSAELLRRAGTAYQRHDKVDEPRRLVVVS